jgi:ferric enterobactin receptor
MSFRLIIGILLLSGLTTNVLSQNKGSVSGMLKDGKTLTPMITATVLLLDRQTNAIVKGAITDTAGRFFLGDLPAGLFLLKVSYFGYKTFMKDSIGIAANASTINLGEIDMEISKEKQLKEVVITSAKNSDKISISTKKFAVEQSLVSKGGTASDLLQNIPTVTIDAGGGVSLRGSDKVNVLVDGKPSLIGGGDITQVLQSIPASAIESIEIVTNPSAKYQSEGGAGIINIILRKNKKLGFNGSVSGTMGTRNNYSGGANLSFENNKLNIYANYDFQHSNIYSNGHQDIQYLDPGNAVVYSNEIFPSITTNNVHSIKGGIDYYISPKSLLSLSGRLNTNTLNRNETLMIDQLAADKNALQTIRNNNLTNSNGLTYNANADLINTFRKPGEELTVSIGYAHGRGNSHQYFNSYAQDAGSINNLPDTSVLHPVGNNRNSYYNIQADYSLPIGTGKLETGYRTEIRIDNRDQQVYNLDDETGGYGENFPLTNFFHSKNQIHALYVNYQNQVHHFSYQVGLRGEDAVLRGDVNGYDSTGASTTLPVKVISRRWYPSLTLVQKIDDSQQLQFSYARRVTRPTPRSYSPIPDVSDPVNYDKGNPNILPEDIHSFELGYSKSGTKANLTLSMYYRITHDFIQHLETAPVKGIITTISENIPHAYTAGLEAICNFHFVKAWNFTLNTNLFENQTDGLPAYGITKSSGFSWNANLTNNFTISKGVSLQVRADYHAPNVVAQDRSNANFGVDAGAKINLLHGNATLSLTGRDILATRKWSFLRDGNGVLLDFERRTVGARGAISFTYNFGKNVFKSKKIEHSTEHQEN